VRTNAALTLLVALPFASALGGCGPGISAATAGHRATGERIFLTSAEIETAKDSGLAGGDIKSVLNLPRPLNYGEFVWSDEGVPKGSIRVRVDLGTQLISVFRGGHEIGTAVVLYGADQKQTPVGRLTVLSKIKDNRSRTYGGAPMPFSLRLTSDGVAIHGSKVRWGAATHGCIGVPVGFARRLFATAHIGDEVVVLDSRNRANLPSSNVQTSIPAITA
jgi:hypothetical protein